MNKVLIFEGFIRIGPRVFVLLGLCMGTRRRVRKEFNVSESIELRIDKRKGNLLSGDWGI